MVDAVVIQKAYITARVSAIPVLCGNFLLRFLLRFLLFTINSCMICYETIYNYIDLQLFKTFFA